MPERIDAASLRYALDAANWFACVRVGPCAPLPFPAAAEALFEALPEVGLLAVEVDAPGVYPPTRKGASRALVLGAGERTRWLLPFTGAGAAVSVGETMDAVVGAGEMKATFLDTSVASCCCCICGGGGAPAEI